MRTKEIYIQSFIDSFDDQTAVINHEGIIQYTNVAWDSFHLEHVETLTTAAFIGDHYLDILSARGNRETWEGIKNVINKSVREYIFTYPCRNHSSEEWYQLIVRRCLLSENQEGLIIVNRNITIEDAPEPANMTAELTRRLNIEQALSEDLRQNGLYFVFQPQIDGVTKEMVGFEVLSRWNHPTLGNISPLEFIGIAEETGNISILTYYLMEEVFSKVSTWIKTVGFSKKVSFNVTSYLLSQKTFFQDLFYLLNRFHIPYHQIELEITEETQLEVDQCTLDNVKACRERGIQIAIDDFGIGFSVLKSLTHFPIDKIKIDKYFTQRLGKDTQTESIIKSIVYLAHSLDCILVAEGVESSKELQGLTDLGCRYFQGYYFSWPLGIEEFEQMYIYK